MEDETREEERNRDRASGARASQRWAEGKYREGEAAAQLSGLVGLWLRVQVEDGTGHRDRVSGARVDQGWARGEEDAQWSARKGSGSRVHVEPAQGKGIGPAGPGAARDWTGRKIVRG